MVDGQDAVDGGTGDGEEVRTNQGPPNMNLRRLVSLFANISRQIDAVHNRLPFSEKSRV